MLLIILILTLLLVSSFAMSINSEQSLQRGSPTIRTLLILQFPADVVLSTIALIVTLIVWAYLWIAGKNPPALDFYFSPEVYTQQWNKY